MKLTSVKLISLLIVFLSIISAYGALLVHRHLGWSSKYFALPIGFFGLIAADKILNKTKNENPISFKILLPVLIVITFLALPWIFAISGISISKIILLNSIFKPVRLGEHHGYGGWFVLVFSLLILNPVVNIKNNLIRLFGLIFLILMVLYGIVLYAPDFFVEQVL